MASLGRRSRDRTIPAARLLCKSGKLRVYMGESVTERPERKPTRHRSKHRARAQGPRARKHEAVLSASAHCILIRPTPSRESVVGCITRPQDYNLRADAMHECAPFSVLTASALPNCALPRLQPPPPCGWCYQGPHSRHSQNATPDHSPWMTSSGALPHS